MIVIPIQIEHVKVLADKLATAARVMDSTFRSAGGAS